MPMSKVCKEKKKSSPCPPPQPQQRKEFLYCWQHDDYGNDEAKTRVPGILVRNRVQRMMTGGMKGEWSGPP